MSQFISVRMTRSERRVCCLFIYIKKDNGYFRNLYMIENAVTEVVKKFKSCCNNPVWEKTSVLCRKHNVSFADMAFSGHTSPNL